MELQQEAQSHVMEFVNLIGQLPRGERVKAAEAIITALVPIFNGFDKGNPEYNPDQPRDDGTGQWTVGGGSAVAGRGLRRGRFAPPDVHSALRSSINSSSLQSSSKRTLGEGLKAWWDRFTDFDTQGGREHMRATVDAAGTAFMVLVIGGLMYALAATYVPAAGQALGRAIGEALRTVLGGGR